MHHFSARITGQTLHVCKHFLQEAATVRYRADRDERGEQAVGGDGDFLETCPTGTNGKPLESSISSGLLLRARTTCE